METSKPSLYTLSSSLGSCSRVGLYSFIHPQIAPAYIQCIHVQLLTFTYNLFLCVCASVRSMASEIHKLLKALLALNFRHAYTTYVKGSNSVVHKYYKHKLFAITQVHMTNYVNLLFFLIQHYIDWHEMLETSELISLKRSFNSSLQFTEINPCRICVDKLCTQECIIILYKRYGH